MADEPIRSQLPNDNYRKGWEETFGYKGGYNGAYNEDGTPIWSRDGWCARCKCSHHPEDAHVDG